VLSIALLKPWPTEREPERWEAFVAALDAPPQPNARLSRLRIEPSQASHRLDGFHALVVGEVGPELAPERIRKGLANHPIRVMVLARLAVAQHTSGFGLHPAVIRCICLCC
jgi:hypothetical protein